jgi:hypothetical protein
MLMEGENIHSNFHRVFRALPSSPRCKTCNAPFKGWGGALMHLTGRDQSRYNPRYCDRANGLCNRAARAGVVISVYRRAGGLKTGSFELPADADGSVN